MQVHFAVFVGVYYLESFPYIVLSDKCFAVEARCYEVLEIDLAVAVNIAFFYYLGPLNLILLLILLSELGLRYSLDVFDG